MSTSWIARARSSVTAIDEKSGLTFQRAVVRDAVRATLDAFVVLRHGRGGCSWKVGAHRDPDPRRESHSADARRFLIRAILSPTDPVFVAAMLGREAVPLRLLSVESAINDRLALPAVMVLRASAGHRAAWQPGSAAAPSDRPTGKKSSGAAPDR